VAGLFPLSQRGKSLDRSLLQSCCSCSNTLLRLFPLSHFRTPPPPSPQFFGGAGSSRLWGSVYGVAPVDCTGLYRLYSLYTRALARRVWGGWGRGSRAAPSRGGAAHLRRRPGTRGPGRLSGRAGGAGGGGARAGRPPLARRGFDCQGARRPCSHPTTTHPAAARLETHGRRRPRIAGPPSASLAPPPARGGERAACRAHSESLKQTPPTPQCSRRQMPKSATRSDRSKSLPPPPPPPPPPPVRLDHGQAK
jgi:hypothetical protein